MSYALLVTLVATTAAAVLAAPLRERVAFFSNLDTQRTTFEKSLGALARSEAVAADVAQRQSASDSTTQVFHADTAALAGADLQNQLNALIAAEGGMVQSAAFRDAPGDGPLTSLVVTVRLRSSITALLGILHGLENRSPVLFVENLAVQSRQRSGQASRDADGDLDVELDVVGFFSSPATP